MKKLQKKLEECRLNGISFNLGKCAFCVNLGVLLGHIVCHDGLLVNPQKIIAITTMPTPTNVIEIKQFLGTIVFIDVISKIL